MKEIWVDFHNHVIPGVDDGARDTEQARSAVTALREEGVRRVVATPHLDGSLTLRPEQLEERLAELDRGWAALREVCDDMPEPTLDRGVELKLDVPEVDVSDPRLRLAGSRAVLVEFPFMTVPPRSEQVLARLRRGGFVPVVAHPERYRGVDPRLNTVSRWLDVGALLQVNAGSLLGRYGPDAQSAAQRLLERGWVSCMASDYHSRREPQLSEARALLESWGGPEPARTLFELNPSRLIHDEQLLPVTPVRPRRSLRRMVRRVLPW